MKEIMEKRGRNSCRGSSSTEVTIDGTESIGFHFKKGPWTPAEDAILVDFVRKNGGGNWNAVHKVSGLRRCGKSCRLRWTNHLRPDLKKCAFTLEEEHLIIELHAKLGNKWARMAAELPGRTDNEIKNFWNTRVKRFQRTGAPIYPLDICLKVLRESQDGQNINSLQITEMLCPNTIPTDSLNMPEVMFRDLECNQGLQYLLQSHPPANSMTENWTIPSPDYCFNWPRMHFPVHLQEPQTSFPGLTENNELPVCSSNHTHAFSDGLYSSSLPATVKLELPSFQYSDTQYPWGEPRSSLPSFGSADTLTQTFQTEETPNCVSPQTSGLLEAIVYESYTLKRSEKVHRQRNKDTLVLHSDGLMSLSHNSFETEWEELGDLNSPLVDSPVSVISDCTPGSKVSLDYQPTGTYL